MPQSMEQMSLNTILWHYSADSSVSQRVKAKMETKELFKQLIILTPFNSRCWTRETQNAELGMTICRSYSSQAVNSFCETIN